MRKLTVLLLLTGIVFILTIPCYSQQTSIFTVYGEVFLSDGVTHAPDGNIVTVKNLNTGISLSTTVGATEPGKYTVVFMDFTGNRAAAVGDVIQTTVKSPEGELLASPAPHTVVAADITAKRVRIDITFPGGVNAGTVTLDSPGPPVWSYTLTQNSGSVTEWSYTGAGIIGASVVGAAQAVGWIVSTQTSTQVVFTAAATPLTSGSLSGFQIMGTIGGMGTWTCHAKSGPIDGSLPVELSAFVAISTEDGVILKWRTESEVNNIGFAIYRSESKDAPFKKIGWVDGAGNSAMPREYQFIDKNAQPGRTYFYYLEDVDIEGLREKSKIIKTTLLEKPPVVIPLRTALFQNYPNPSNPETWLPYELAQDAEVSFTIHNAEGQFVRVLTLGHKKTGGYITKNKAAYWDGKDQYGEHVASGVYFYTLQAGKFRATKKLLIAR